MKTCLLVLVLVTTTCALSVGRGPANLARTRQKAVRMNFFADLQKGFAKLTAGDYDEEAIMARVQREIERKPCIMYSLSTCPFCAKAKSALDGMGAMYSVVEFDMDPDGWAVKAELSTITGQTSAPQVFVGGEFVGGCNDGGKGGVLPLQATGELAQMLSKAGALSSRV